MCIYIAATQHYDISSRRDMKNQQEKEKCIIIKLK